jgi:uncharacterized protein (TIGR03032 family)
LTPPAADKWRKHEAAIAPLLPKLTTPVERTSEPTLRSVHTTTFTELLQALRCSVLVSTYGAGRVVVLRAHGDVTNTHFRSFQKPLGLALAGQRLAIGTEGEVREYRDVPALAPEHDACFSLHGTHVTGDAQIHELAYAESELWCVNTTFSCLGTLSPEHGFVPRWRPSDGHCRLNGLAVVDGHPRFVSAVGGVVIDVERNQVLAENLPLPHSPRWHRGRLWILNSGRGGLGTVDLDSGRYHEVARLPGFTRGLDFVGKYAFVGLSHDIEIASLPLEKRRCGVWVVDTETGKTLAFVEFRGEVQEIFSVVVAPGVRFPEIAQTT